MLYKYRKLILIILVVLTVFVLTFMFKTLRKKPKIVVNTGAKTELRESIENSVGGYISEKEFEISYLKSEQVYVINIKDDPFEENKNKALSYLRNRGIDPDYLPHICTVSKGVNATEEQVNRCGNSGVY